jgi:lipoprotein-releasing system permease protein
LRISGFIASRIMRSGDKSQFSRPIVRIATTGIAVGVALMIVSLAIVRGFQQEIRSKVVGFGSHFQVVANLDNSPRDSESMLIDTNVYENLKSIEGVKHVQLFATKPGILEAPEALQGVVIKGISRDFDWTFFDDKIVEGTRINVDSGDARFDIMLSTYMAKRMQVKTGDKISLYFINNEADTRQRNFVVSGLYNTGLQEFDEQYVFVDLAHVQRLSGWGMQVQLYVDTTVSSSVYSVEATVYNNGGDEEFKWSNKEWKGRGPHVVEAGRDTTFSVIVRENSDLPGDTASVAIRYLPDSSGKKTISIEYSSSGGTEKYYVGGYEVLISDYEKLSSINDEIFKAIPFFLRCQDVQSRSPEIFSWLDMLDINVIIIMVLMIIISMVNMTSALLILILERQNMIGVLKALGDTDRSIITIFIIHAIAIIGRGVIYGSLIGLLLIFLQWKFEWVTLNPEEYFVSSVPVSIEPFYILMIDAGTVLICGVFLLVPSFLVTRITPIKSIRFN